ncbi:MAG: hypothetical protein AB1746_17055 [Candidatus Zixiibacteriota bacterium]
MRYLKLLFPVFVLILAGSLYFVGCSDDDDNPAGSDYIVELPPQSSFVMDFSDFEGSLLKIDAEDQPMTNANWAFAGLNVAVWNAIITVGMAVPVASFLEAFKHEAVKQPDGSWQWSYNFILGGVYTARLNGKLVGSEIQWKMYLSKESEFVDFLWYEGTCNLARSEGEWTLYHSPDDPTELLLIEWHYFTTPGKADLKYTNIAPDGPENGGYIFYGIDESATYDRFYDIYNKGQDDLVEIEWDFTTKEGRVRNELHFGDTDWHCWDGTLSDVSCK